MQRREFLKTSAGAAATVAALSMHQLASAASAPARSDSLWRGFNLLEFFRGHGPPQPFRESDFELMAEWGFNFARIPMSYWHWSQPDPAQWMTIDEEPFELLDRVIDLGRQYGVHINLNLHRIPGYCINGRDREPFDLFAGPAEERARALEAARHHWRFIAHRYRAVPSTQLSFDLINEPPDIPGAAYREVVAPLVAAIRAENPARLIVADGIAVGRVPVPEIVDLNLMQSSRGYDPMEVSHYRASWVPGYTEDSWPQPTWPMTVRGETIDREVLRRRLVTPWKAIEAQGVTVHVGEWGCYNHTPHAVALAWMKDLLELWQEAGWGWALWNLRGDFGVLDSERADVRYENFKGHLLDRKMLELLRAH
jgi:endoglucanase